MPSCRPLKKTRRWSALVSRCARTKATLSFRKSFPVRRPPRRKTSMPAIASSRLLRAPDLPTAVAQAIGQIVERPVRLLLESPREHREIGALAHQLKGAEGGNLFGEVNRHVLAGFVNFAIARLAKPDQVVILRHHLAGRAREVNG